MQAVGLLAGLMALAPSILTTAAEHHTEAEVEHQHGHQGPRRQPMECQTVSQQAQRHLATAAATTHGAPRHQLIMLKPLTTTGDLTSRKPTTAGALTLTMLQLLGSTCRRLLRRR
jgi:hypothetical protein